MIPQDKAKTLVNGFYQPLGHLKCGVNNSIMWEHAKKYALICVEEILKSQPTQPTIDGFGLNEFPILFDVIEATEFYEQLKTEIEKL